MIEWTKTEIGECATMEEVPKGARVEAIDNVATIGKCELCEAYIMEGDPYCHDDDGSYWHRKCEGQVAADRFSE